jgi:flagellin
MNSLRQLGANNANTGKNLEKLSSGYKINRAGDDAAGLAISEKMRGQINGLEQAQNNANDGISLIQTAEGGLNETHAILQRMRELAVQSANGTYDNENDRANLDKEVTALREEIDRIAESTKFNGKTLLDGSIDGAVGTTTSVTTDNFGFTVDGLAAGSKIVVNSSGTGTNGIAFASGTLTITLDSGATFNQATVSGLVTAAAISGLSITVTTSGSVVSANDVSGVEVNSAALTLQIGANGTDEEQVSLSVKDMGQSGLGLSTVNVKSAVDAKAAIKTIDDAINTVSSTRADLGALQNRLEHTVNNLGTTSENLTAAESRIRDVDMAKEMMEYTKNNILSQAAQAMLAQANQQPQGVLQLLQ